MHNEPINPSNPYGATVEETVSGERLTGEALMLYISTRLSGLDEDIKGLIGDAEDAIARKRYLNEIKEWAGHVAEARTVDKARGEESGEATTAEFSAAWNEFPEAPEGMRTLKMDVHSKLPEPSKFKDDAIKNFEARVTEMIDEINGTSEIAMLRLNQLMGQRTVCIQAVTGMLSKIDQGNTAIVGNL